MRTIIIKVVLVLAFALALPVAASATPLMWVLQDVVFLDGVATANGSFTYDADTGIVSSVGITTDPGPGFLCSDPPACSAFSVVPGAFSAASFDVGFAPASSLVITLQSGALGDLTGSPIFQLLLASPLTNSGGTVSLVPASLGEYYCQTSACDTFNIETQIVRTMTGSVTSVPEPATLTLLGGGLVSVLLRRRRSP
jgi:hypothetical protein